MNNKELISVIVPIYNAEMFLDKCISSILKQTYTNLEVILVDDGSKDSSLLMCENYKKKDSRIKLIHQDNMGLSAARNVGLDNMSGDYCVFVDADDEILETMIEELYNLLKEYDADISVCNYLNIYEGEDYVLKQPSTTKIDVYEDNSKYSQMFERYVVTVVQWNKLFKKYIFDDLRFPVGRYHEDEFVIHHELYRANRVVYTNRILYLYYRHKESITLNGSMRKRYDAISGIDDSVRFYTRHRMKTYRKKAINRLLYIIDDALGSKQFNDYDEYYQKIKDIEKRFLFLKCYYALKFKAYKYKLKLIDYFNKKSS